MPNNHPKIIKLKVNTVQEIKGAVNDYTNPLELFREAISNSYDAHSASICIEVNSINDNDKKVVQIVIQDSGDGMTESELQSFFDLGNSTKLNSKKAIGCKGHGTKPMLKSSKLIVETSTGTDGRKAIMEKPYEKLINGGIPEAIVEEDNNLPKGTKIIIECYNENSTQHLSHDELKDYIQWFTAHGSIESQFIPSTNVTLSLKGLNQLDPEIIPRGHPFAKENYDPDSLKLEFGENAALHFVKHFTKEGTLTKFPDIRFQAVFVIEGKNAKYNYNKMLRKQGLPPKEGSYTIQSRYGLYVAKDFIPVQTKNDWLNFKGSEHTKLHAFINCQQLSLTANRGSIDNTQPDILLSLEEAAYELYEDIKKSIHFAVLKELEQYAKAHKKIIQEQKQLKNRIKIYNNQNVIEFDGILIDEPIQESGVNHILTLLLLKTDFFPFTAHCYSDSGIDLLVTNKADSMNNKPVACYAELKLFLTKKMNHSFENIYYIICWKSKIKNQGIVVDVAGEERILNIVAPENKGDYTRFFLENKRNHKKIEVFCLESILLEKFGKTFRPKNDSETLNLQL